MSTPVTDSPLERAIAGKFMLDFDDPDEILQLITRWPIAGVTLYRRRNIDNPQQVKELTTKLQNAAHAAGHPPLLTAADQEGGQLMAIGKGVTLFPGNMALGAADSPDLARKVGSTIGLELAAMGININYAPICDVMTNPRNPVMGVRSFGEDPVKVGQLAVAMIAGIQSAGVAATAKHFPGHGATESDSHYDVPLVPHDRARLEQVELLPFAAAIEADVKLMMTAHVAVPALTGGSSMVATLSRPVMDDLLRGALGFNNVIITDALNMGAIAQGINQVIDVIAATLAGVDLMLLGNDPDVREAVYAGLIQAVRRGVIPQITIERSAQRVDQLRAWLTAQSAPEIDIIGCAEHLDIANEVARQSITLVRDEARLLPLRLKSDTRIGVVLPQPEDLTPADTSSYITHTLAQAIRQFHRAVEEFTVSHYPEDAEIAGVRTQVESCDLLIVGTIATHTNTSQAALVSALHDLSNPMIVIALRTPYDLLAFPQVSTYVCTYSLLEPSMHALAQALWGEISFAGRLPVSVGDDYPVGYQAS